MNEMALIYAITRYIDGQCSESEARAVRRLVAVDERARSCMERLEHSTGAFSSALHATAAQTGHGDLEAIDGVPGAETDAETGPVDFDTLSALAEDRLDDAGRERVEQMLRSDPAALSFAMRFIRAGAVAGNEAGIEPPDALLEEALSRERTATEEHETLVNEAEPEESGEEWGRVVLPMPDRDTAHARIRVGGVDFALQLERVSAGACRLEIVIRRPGHGGRQLEITVSDNTTHRKVFSSETSEQGVTTVPRIPAGSYTLHIADSPLKLDLEIQD